MNQRKAYDCFLYDGEIDALEIRLHELANVITRFVIVEADTTFVGQRKTLSFDPFDPHVAPFTARIRNVVVKDMPPGENSWQREAWQRNAILRGIPDASDDDLVLLSNVDEIPRAATVQEIVGDTKNRIFGLQLSFYSFFVNYRNIAGPEPAATCTVAARRADFEKIAPHDLRNAARRGELPVRVLPDAGWHFTCLMGASGVRRRLVAKGVRVPRSIEIFEIVRRRKDPFGRPGFQWEIADPTELPSWLQANPRAMSHLFCPRCPVEDLSRRAAKSLVGFLQVIRKTPATRPVIICPYLHVHEASEIAAKFGLDKPHGRKLDFFLWQDTGGLGPERAYQHCWEQFPDRDIILLHSDMAPMPDDPANRWYDALLHYRNRLPKTGMLACNLFFPATKSDTSRRVQCAGGTFREGQIGHLSEGGIPAKALRKVRPVDWVTFGGVLIRREVIRACGKFDDRYRWAYVMDVDYCFEARLRGFRLFQVPVSLQHEQNRTTRGLWEADPQLRGYVSRNVELFYEKWRPFGAALPSIG